VPDSGGVTLTAIHLHPVKACRRTEVDRAIVGRYGLQGDREWQVQGPQGQMLNQRKFPALARVRPTILADGLRLEHDGMPVLEVPRPQVADREGKTGFGPVAVADAGDDAATWFEQLLGVSCRLAAIAEGYHRRIVIDDDWFEQEVSLADAAPVLLVNTASHRFLLDRAAEPFGIERFRPNLIVDAGAPWAEDIWRTASIGSAEVRFVLPWPRCAVPQVDQDTGERRREPAVVLKRHRWCTTTPNLPEAIGALLAGNALFGVAGSIGPVGAEVAVGDPVEVTTFGEPLVSMPD
jgi:uncharacterized protein